MRTLDIFIIAGLLVIGLLVMDKKHYQDITSQFEPPKPAPNFYENAFEKGLPQEYLPTDVTKFGSKDKLREDLDYRLKRLQYAYKEEAAEINKLEGTPQQKEAAIRELDQKHQAAVEAFRTKRAALLQEFDYKQAMDDKGLR